MELSFTRPLVAGTQGQSTSFDPATLKVTLGVNSGSVKLLELTPDTIRARFTPPKVGYPHWLLLAIALSPKDGSSTPSASTGAVKSTKGGLSIFKIPLTGVARLQADTIPGARVYGEIAGRRAGPFIANAKGEVELRLPARPGESVATIRAKDRSGGATRRKMSLPVPPQNRLVGMPAAPGAALGPAGGLWVYILGGEKLVPRLQASAEPEGLNAPENHPKGGLFSTQALGHGLVAYSLDATKVAGFDSITLKLRLQGERASKLDSRLQIPHSLRGQTLAILVPSGAPDEAFSDALRMQGLRPHRHVGTLPDAERAKQVMLDHADAAVAWLSIRDAGLQAMLARPGTVPGGVIIEYFTPPPGDPTLALQALAKNLKDALQRAPIPQPEEALATQGSAGSTGHSPAASDAAPLPPLPTPSLGVCVVEPAGWWPGQRFALRVGAGTALSLGGAGLAGSLELGGEFRGRARVKFLPRALRRLRLLAHADLRVSSGQRLPGDGIAVWIRDRGLILGAAALLPLDAKRPRPLLLGPSVDLSLGQLRALPVTPGSLSEPAAQLSAWLGLGAQARLRLSRIELYGQLSLRIPLHSLRVLPSTGLALRDHQVGLGLVLGSSLPL